MRTLPPSPTIPALCLLLLGAAASAQAPPKPAVPPEGNTRGLADAVGFAVLGKQMDLVAAHCEKLAGPKSGVTGPTVAAICPHDDYVYAGPVYVDALRGLKAKTVVLFGVCHKARALGLMDKLVFDSFDRWCGRFSVPLGLATLRLLTDALSRRPLEGASTGYGTSVGTGLLPFEKAGLGATAPAHLHHWVSYVAVVYW